MSGLQSAVALSSPHLESNFTWVCSPSPSLSMSEGFKKTKVWWEKSLNLPARLERTALPILKRDSPSTARNGKSGSAGGMWANLEGFGTVWGSVVPPLSRILSPEAVGSVQGQKMGEPSSLA